MTRAPTGCPKSETGTGEPAGPRAAGAILLALEGERLEIGTDENLTKGLHSAFDAIKDKGTSFILKDGAFIPAAKDMVRERLKYTEEPDLCLRAYTETR